MPLMNVDGVRSTGPASSRFFIRDSTSDTMAVASTRARFAPRQKCVPPPPNATCGFGVRLDVETVGIGELGLVSVGRRVKHRRPVTLVYAHPAQFGVLRGRAA